LIQAKDSGDLQRRNPILAIFAANIISHSSLTRVTRSRDCWRAFEWRFSNIRLALKFVSTRIATLSKQCAVGEES
jgi:hypothetical protein